MQTLRCPADGRGIVTIPVTAGEEVAEATDDLLESRVVLLCAPFGRGDPGSEGLFRLVMRRHQIPVYIVVWAEPRQCRDEATSNLGIFEKLRVKVAGETVRARRQRLAPQCQGKGSFDGKGPIRGRNGLRFHCGAEAVGRLQQTPMDAVLQLAPSPALANVAVVDERAAGQSLSASTSTSCSPSISRSAFPFDVGRLRDPQYIDRVADELAATRDKLAESERNSTALLALASATPKPTLFVEGVTDAAIIEAAWSVFFPAA